MSDRTAEDEALQNECERLLNITRIQQKQIERLMEERDRVKVQLEAAQKRVAELETEMQRIRDSGLCPDVPPPITKWAKEIRKLPTHNLMKGIYD
jgi:DNA repair exonuclease SbcCD ATPase subunit